jgi:hypothetical protein
MAISLDTPRTPTLKLSEHKQHVIGRVLHVAVVPWIEYGTTRQKVGKDGQLRTQEVVTLGVIKGTGHKSDGEALVEGVEVAVWLNGHRRWDWSEAKKAAKGLNVGDRVRITYVRDEPSKGGAPKKVWAFEIVRASSDDPMVAEAEAAYHRIEAARAAAPKREQASGAAPSQDFDDESDDEPRQAPARTPQMDDDIPFGLLAALAGGLLLKAFEVMHGTMDISAWV